MSVFQAKHYKVIAKAIDESRMSKNPDLIHASHLVSILAFYFSQDNHHFNAQSFREACGEHQNKS